MFNQNDLKEVETNDASSTGSQDLISASPVDAFGEPRQRRLLSVHSLTLKRIQDDAVGNRRHYVPEEDAQSIISRPENDFGSRKWIEKHTTNIYETTKNRSYSEWAETLLPIYKWLRVYPWKSTLPKDIIAGMTVGAMVVPQGMSYAKLAGLPVQYGLYSALVPVYAYAIFGTSRQLAVGPVALVSLLLSTGLTQALEKRGISQDATNYDEMYATLAVQTAFLIGIIYIILGLLRLGFITVFLSHAVISGFTTAAAIIIALSQIKYFFGIKLTQSDHLTVIIKSIIQNISGFNWKTFLLGTMSLLALLYTKRIGKIYPRYKWVRAAAPLTVTILAIVCEVIWDWSKKGIPIVAYIPKGLPPVTANQLFPIGDNVGDLILPVISIGIVGFMESIAVAKKLADAHNYQVDPSLELIGLGMANLSAGLFSGYPITGSFSRTAVSNESGAQSGISGVVTATIVGFVLLFLTPVFERMVRLLETGPCPFLFLPKHFLQLGSN